MPHSKQEGVASMQDHPPMTTLNCTTTEEE